MSYQTVPPGAKADRAEEVLESAGFGGIVEPDAVEGELFASTHKDDSPTAVRNSDLPDGWGITYLRHRGDFLDIAVGPV